MRTRDAIARLPLMRAIGAVERLARANGARPLPEYLPESAG
jgi:hypothetical protein